MKRTTIRDEMKVQQTETGRNTGMTTRAVLKAVCVMAEKDVERVVFVSRCRGASDHARAVLFNVYKVLGFNPHCDENQSIRYEKKWDGVGQGIEAEIMFITAEQADANWDKYMRGKITKSVFD